MEGISKLKWKLVIIGFHFLIPNLTAQHPDSIEKFNDVLQSFGFIQYDAEYYTIDSRNSLLEHHLIYQPFLNNVNIINIGFGLTHSFLEGNSHFLPADLDITYQRNFKANKYKQSGFQGVGTKLKLIIPTGKNEYYSGFDSWSIEPLVGTQWLLKNSNWLIASQIRYNYSFASLPAKKPRFSFLRIDFFIGYESNVFWVFFEPDYRFIPSRDRHNLFVSFDFGYKFLHKIGIHFTGKPRIIGTDFYESLYTLGLYYFL